MDVSTLKRLALRAFAAINFMRRRSTADARQIFTDAAAMHRFFDEQDEAGYDCFVTRRGDSWEVRSYKRRK